MRGISGLRSYLRRTLFRVRGMKPWTTGYGDHKTHAIRAELARGTFDPERLPNGYGFRLDERIVEYPWLFSRLPAEEGTLLDAGSVLNYGFILQHPRLANKRVFISTLAPEAQCHWRRGVSYIFEDLRDSCLRDDYFDWVVSLSTLEHIGFDNTMLYTADPSKLEHDPKAYLDAIRDLRRVLKPGGTLFVSLPFGRHVEHGWFQVFDAAMVDKLITEFAPRSHLETHFRYAPEGWRRSSRAESAEATYFDIHRRVGYDPDYAAASRGVICLELVK